ncbi:MAG: hypothetical protein AVO33_01545 [delta proteobacterium ML8_F1]|nr:MAG: hypothetical protein AVO33_01545 [delta proteobacterium ML8_F1]
MDMTALEQKKYDETFERIYVNFKYQLENDKNFGLSELKKLLETYHTYEGHDWIGRGELKNISIGATIAALSRLLSEYQEEDPV